MNNKTLFWRSFIKARSVTQLSSAQKPSSVLQWLHEWGSKEYIISMLLVWSRVFIQILDLL